MALGDGELRQEQKHHRDQLLLPLHMDGFLKLAGAQLTVQFVSQPVKEMPH